MIDKAYKVLQVVRSPKCKQVLDYLQGGDRTVTEIYTKLNVQQPEASAILRRLRGVGAVVTTRQGREVFYDLN